MGFQVNSRPDGGMIIYPTAAQGAALPALSPPNIESELSYAYLHAVAAKAAMSCRDTNRHEDNAGIDAQLTAWGAFPGGYLTEVSLNIQLKATISEPVDDGTYLHYTLQGVERYRALRQETIATPRILVVLFLPRDAQEWLRHSDDELVLRKCAYWVSLRNAPDTTNTRGVTVLIPKAQVFSPDSLQDIVACIARRDIPCWEAP